MKAGPARRRKIERGFSLLELLVVLVLMALVTGIVAPRLVTLYDSSLAAFEKEDLLRQLSGLGYRAFSAGENYTLWNDLEGGRPEDLLDVPEGWRVVVEQPIRYAASGICEGGTVVLMRGELVYRVELLAPFCRDNSD